ncbi:unnamed protein product [Paramecium sonneborni]|uniref:Uncharacterized protein n=1 Tax=Paramecium sonneborni TaxID=65129 RepID=A0A8S1RXY4_9CILI|nr:unnamed protein product [Paramecium sonneborni]
MISLNNQIQRMIQPSTTKMRFSFQKYQGPLQFIWKVFQEAIEFFDKVIQFNLLNDSTYNNNCIDYCNLYIIRLTLLQFNGFFILVELKNYSEAFQFIEKSIQLNSKNYIEFKNKDQFKQQLISIGSLLIMYIKIRRNFQIIQNHHIKSKEHKSIINNRYFFSMPIFFLNLPQQDYWINWLINENLLMKRAYI